MHDLQKKWNIFHAWLEQTYTKVKNTIFPPTDFPWVKDKKRRQFLEAKFKCFLEVFQENPAFQVSLKDRETMHLQGSEFVYGEITFPAFIFALDQARVKPGDIFYDLGCGSGKAVATAAMAFPFSKVIGVEYLPGLHELASKHIANLKKVDRRVAQPKEKGPHIELIREDMRNVDFTKADVIFMNTCFSADIWNFILEAFPKLKVGARVIFTSKSAPEPLFQKLWGGQLKMTWGMNTVNVFIKRA